MEHVRVKENSPVYEASGPPQLFAVGCYNGECHLIRFSEGDGLYDVMREANRIRRQWGKSKRLESDRAG